MGFRRTELAQTEERLSADVDMLRSRNQGATPAQRHLPIRPATPPVHHHEPIAVDTTSALTWPDVLDRSATELTWVGLVRRAGAPASGTLTCTHRQPAPCFGFFERARRLLVFASVGGCPERRCLTGAAGACECRRWGREPPAELPVHAQGTHAQHNPQWLACCDCCYCFSAERPDPVRLLCQAAAAAASALSAAVSTAASLSLPSLSLPLIACAPRATATTTARRQPPPRRRAKVQAPTLPALSQIPS